MDASVARAVLGILLLLVQGVLIVPILVRVRRAQSSAGVSMVGELLWVVAGAGWAGYGFVSGSATLVVSGAIATLGGAALVTLLWPYASSGARRGAVVAASGAAVVFAVAAARGTGALAAALAVFGVVQFLPQLVRTLGTARRPGSGAAVSILGAGLRAGYTAGWALYAGAWFWWGIPVERIDAPLLAWGLAGAVTFSFQAVVAARERRARVEPPRRRAA